MSWMARTQMALLVRTPIQFSFMQIWFWLTEFLHTSMLAWPCLPSCRLHVVYLWNPRPRLGGETHFRKDPLHELQRVPAEVWRCSVWAKVLPEKPLKHEMLLRGGGADSLHLLHLYLRDHLYTFCSSGLLLLFSSSHVVNAHQTVHLI